MFPHEYDKNDLQDIDYQVHEFCTKKALQKNKKTPCNLCPDFRVEICTLIASENLKKKKAKIKQLGLFDIEELIV